MIDDDSIPEHTGECAAHLAIMEQSLITLETGGAQEDGELVPRLQQATRAMLAEASRCQQAKLRALAQRTERALAPMSFDLGAPAPERVTLILRAIDTLRAMLNKPDGGAAFDVSEIMRSLAGLGPAAVPARPPRRADWRLQTLLVEDDFTSRLVLQTFLSRYGDCHVAVNGREAVDALGRALERGERYDLICMDIMMPEMDGGEAVRRIRRLEEEHGILSTAGAKIIMTTCVNNLKDVAQCFRDLCDAYLVKPIDLAQLLAHMKSYDLVA